MDIKNQINFMEVIRWKKSTGNFGTIDGFEGRIKG